MAFLTEVDTDRLNIRGSRDPLGFVPLWGSVGRKVVGNVTTASTSLRGFTTLLLGFYFAEQVVPGGRDRERDRLHAFLKFEQLAGYARWYVNEDGNLRGITAVKKRLSGIEPIAIGADAASQLLANQRTYGLWGLYTIPARASGLVSEGEVTLTPGAREFVEREYHALLVGSPQSPGNRIRALLGRPNAEIVPNGRDERVVQALGAALAPAPTVLERAFYRSSLILGGPTAAGTSGWQPLFARLMDDVLPIANTFGYAELAAIAAASAKKEETCPLGTHLEKIRELERFLVPAANLFGYLQSRDKAQVNAVVRELRDTWGKGLAFVRADAIDALRAELAQAFPDAPAVDRLVGLARSLQTGDFGPAVAAAMQHNEYVMNLRGGAAPWIAIKNGRVDVRYTGEQETRLIPPPELKQAWRSTYYLNPLRMVSYELRAR